MFTSLWETLPRGGLRKPEGVRSSSSREKAHRGSLRKNWTNIDSTPSLQIFIYTCMYLSLHMLSYHTVHHGVQGLQGGFSVIWKLVIWPHSLFLLLEQCSILFSSYFIFKYTLFTFLMNYMLRNCLARQGAQSCCCVWYEPLGDIIWYFPVYVDTMISTRFCLRVLWIKRIQYEH